MVLALNKTITKKTKIKVFGILWICIFLIEFFVSKRVTYYDSGAYWTLADGVIDEGLLAYPESFRGYFFPTLISLLKRISIHIFSSRWMLFILFGSFCAAFTITIIIPWFLKVKEITVKRYLIGSIVNTIIFWYFWKDAIIYPLSDIFAMFFYAIGIMTLVNIVKLDGKNLILKAFLSSVFTGLALYAAYNTRTIYLLPSVLTVVVIIIYIYKGKIPSRHKFKKIITLVLGCVIGIGILATPQMIINEHYTGKFTPKVLTEFKSDYQYSLSEWQLLQGMMYERYETYVGADIENQKTGGVIFYDSAGQKIVELEQLGINISVIEFLKLFFKYPLDFIGMYVRSTISYMTLIWNELYVTDLMVDKSINIGICIIFWIIAFSALFFTPKQKALQWIKNTIVSIPLICYIVPCILIIPAAPEVRFFLPLYLLCYGYLCYKIDYKKLFIIIKPFWIRYLVICFLIICAWVAIIGDVLSDKHTGTMLIAGNQQLEQEELVVDNPIKKSDFDITIDGNNIEVVNNYQVGKYQYTWYVYKDNQTIEKLPYTNENFINYTFTGDGEYGIKGFVKSNENDADRQSIMACEIWVNNGVAKVLKD